MNTSSSFASIFADEPARSMNSGVNGTPRIAIDPENIKKGLGQLVLTLVELIRQLLEKQAIRRIEGGSLTDDEMERMGLVFMELNTQLNWLKAEFGLTDEDLNLDLGPLGKLI